MQREEAEAVYDAGREMVISMLVGLSAQIAELNAVVAGQGVRIEELERRLARNSQNSSQPPSSDGSAAPKPKAKKRSGRKPGGQSGHPGRHRAMVASEDVDEIVVHRPKACECGACLDGAPEAGGPDRHQVWEIPEVAATVTEHRRLRLRCEGCGRTTVAELSAGSPAGAFGARLQATVVSLSAARLSREQVAAIIAECHGVQISAASVQVVLERASEALRAPHAEIAKAISGAAVLNADETGWKIAGHGAQLWSAASADATIFRIASSRSQAEAKALLGEGFAGICGTDRYAGYSFLEPERRALCWSHLARDYQALAERPRSVGALGRGLVEATNAMFATWHQERAEGRRPDWSEEPMATHHDRIMELLERGSRMRDRKTARFCESLLRQWPSLWLFTELEGVEPTNNVAERALRNAVIWRKLSFGTRSEKGTRFAERLLSVRETCRLQGRSLHEYIVEAIGAHISGTPAPPVLVARGSPG